MKGKATSFDIAYHAGVSQSTVSRALRDSPLVSEETRKRVKEVAKELNYKVDKNASNLRSQQSGTIALLLFEDPTTDDSHINPFFLSMLGSITRAVSKAGYDLLVSFQQLSEDWHADYEDTNRADGIILLGYGDFHDYEEKLQQLHEQHTHFVIWGAIEQSQTGVSVRCDNHQGAYDITSHLLNKGRKRFAFVGSASTGSPEFMERYQGMCHAVEQQGKGCEVVAQKDAITTEKSGYEATKAMLESGVKVDAIMAASDLIAIGVMGALHDHGLKVPDDVSVVGFDDIPIASYTVPPLSTVQQDTNKAGEILVDKLLKLIKGEDVSTEMIPANVIIRKSCGGAA